MPGIEELLRGELKRVTGQVQPGQLRPLRPPAPGAGWHRRLLPVSAAAAVTAIVTGAALLAGTSARPQFSTGHTAGPAPMPPYYLTVAKTATGLEAVVRDSAHGSVTGTALLPQTQASAGQSVAAAANDRTFVIAVNVTGASTLPGTVAMRYFWLSISAGGRPVASAELTPVLGNGEPLTGMALSPDGTRLALSLKHLGLLANVEPYGDVEVLNLATGKIRTWTGRGQPGYFPGAPTWVDGDRTLAFTWWRSASLITSAAVMIGVRQLDTSAPGGNLLASRLFPFTESSADIRTPSMIITSDGAEIVTAECYDTALNGHSHGRVTAQIIELSAADGSELRSLHTQTASYTTASERGILDATCTVLSVDPSGHHLLIQALGFGRLDNGVFTALPGATPNEIYLAAGW